MTANVEPEFMQSLPEGDWNLTEGDKKSPTLIYCSDDGKKVKVPSIWYNQPVSWRVEYFRFLAKQGFDKAAELWVEKGKDDEITNIVMDASWIKAEAEVMEQTGQFIDFDSTDIDNDIIVIYQRLHQAGAPVERIIAALVRRMSALEKLPPNTLGLENALLSAASYLCSLLDPNLFETPVLQRTTNEVLRLIRMVCADLNGRLPVEAVPYFQEIMSCIHDDHRSISKTDGNGMAAVIKRDAIRLKCFARLYEAKITGDAAKKIKALINRLDCDVATSLPNIAQRTAHPSAGSVLI